MLSVAVSMLSVAVSMLSVAVSMLSVAVHITVICSSAGHRLPLHTPHTILTSRPECSAAHSVSNSSFSAGHKQ